MNTIDKRQLEFARLRLAAQFHAVILKAIIECQIDEGWIAARLDQPIKVVAEWLNSPSKWTLDIISDLILSVAADFDDFKVSPIRYRNLRQEVETAEAQRLARPA